MRGWCADSKQRRRLTTDLCPLILPGPLDLGSARYICIALNSELWVALSTRDRSFKKMAGYCIMRRPLAREKMVTLQKAP